MKIVTHSGTFHADEVFALATLHLAFPEEHIEIVRTRDPEVIATGDFVVDVGGIYDPSKNRFDHHQVEGAGKRENGIPYSSFGIVWKAYGEKVCQSKEVAENIDERIVMPIDALDNGVAIEKSIVSEAHEYPIGDVIDAFNPSWKEGDQNVNRDEAFQEALQISKRILEREIVKTRDLLEGKQIAKDAYLTAPDKRIVVFDKYVPWSDVLNKFPEPLFAVYPSSDGTNWHIQAVRDDLFSYKNRKDFPKTWAGLRDEELVKVTGVSDAVFVHKGLFFAAAKNKEGAMKLAKLATKV